MKLFPHQVDALEKTENQNRVAYYHDMGLGKTFTGSEKMIRLSGRTNLVICQKSKIDDWINHFQEHYSIKVIDLTDKTKDGKRKIEAILMNIKHETNIPCVLVINYDLIFRRPDLLKVNFDTIMLDESSIIQNRTSKRSKAILGINSKNVILLSGTPTGGKYERLWSQIKLLGWDISEKLFMNQFVIYHYEDNEGFPLLIIDGYKNVDRLKMKLREHGCHFLKTEEVFDLPDQIHNNVYVKTSKEYWKFKKDRIINIDGMNFVGDTTLTKMLYERQLCGLVSKEKLEAFRDIVESTGDRLIVFYNFTSELQQLVKICEGRRRSYVNGSVKDLTAYEECDDSITFIQYQAGAMGLNLQKANKIIYFTPPLSSELFEQSKKRIHRIGQDQSCFYYYLTCKGSIEERIYKTLSMRRDYTDRLFEEEE